MEENQEVTQGQRLSRGEFAGFALTMLAVAAALVIAVTGAVGGPWFGAVLAAMVATIFAGAVIAGKD